jgi:hypothetical protein
MDFEEKMDAIRMNLELAFHDIESLRASVETIGVKIDALRVASASQYESIQVLATTSENLVKTASRQQDDLQALKKISGDLARAAEVHDRRIAGLEGRI